MAGLPALISFLLLVAGGAIGASMQRWYHWDTAAVTTWSIARWPVSLGLTVVTVSVLFRYAPHRRQPALSWLMVGAGLTTALWWLVSLVLAAYAAESREFGTTYGPLTGVMALLLWANLTGIALFVGVAFAAQLEARRVGISGRAMADQHRSWEERDEITPTSRP
jgi:YihY family inner membrane protein